MVVDVVVEVGVVVDVDDGVDVVVVDVVVVDVVVGLEPAGWKDKGK